MIDEVDDELVSQIVVDIHIIDEVLKHVWKAVQLYYNDFNDEVLIIMLIVAIYDDDEVELDELEVIEIYELDAVENDDYE